MARHPELRSTMASAEDLAFVRARAESSAACFAAACERYANRVCFSSAHGELTYGVLWQRVTGIVAGWASAGLVTPGTRVGLCGSAGADWVIADLACLVAGAVSVPLAVNLPPDELRALVEHAHLTAIVAGSAQLPLIARALAASAVRPKLVLLDGDAGEPVEGVDVVSTLHELAAAGAGASVQLPRAEHDRLVTVMYTSGSTSRPKGVMLSEQRWRSQLHTALTWPSFPFLMIGYMPPSSLAGRRLVLEAMMHGGRTHFATGALPFDDLPIARPTLVPFIPRLSGMIHQMFLSKVAARFGGAVAPDTALDDPRGREVADELGATLLGDRLCLIRIGSAGTAPNIVEFLDRCFGVAVSNGYGSTECGSVTLDGHALPHIDYKLVEVPELEYSPNDRPYPRGELLVRSPENTLGYLDDPETTAALFDADGFVHTGDIVEERGPRQIAVIDRRTSVTKLAQGQFVATSRLEELYAAGSALIEQIYLYANSRHAYLLAVIVPSTELRELGDDELRRKLREEIDRIARAAGRRTHEVPRDFLIEREPFTQRNELLTESGKQATRRLRERFGVRLDALHDAIEARQLAGREALTGTVEDKLRAALGIALGLTAADIAAAPAGVSFTGFGGDSISALRFCTLVQEALGAEVSAGSVLDPSASLTAIVARIAARLGHSAGVSYVEVHGEGTEVRASDLDRLVPTEPPAGGAAASPPRSVLLTGATGFLGRFLLDELAARGARVVCLVRGERDAAARDRLRAQLTEGGGELGVRLAGSVDDGRIEVLAGDMSAPGLGLARDAYTALGDRIDAIVHNGALVNHAMSYRHLFEPNLLGTVEVARLAARRPGIAIHFVSSIAVATRPAAPVGETETARALWTTRPIGGGDEDHAVGYATSKWAGEVVLEAVHQRHGVPVKIFRCSNLAPHADHIGHLNWADNTNRLLFTLLATGVAPDTFYRGTGGRYDLLPVGVVAAAIAASALAGTTGFAIRHVSNDELAPVSLDTLAGWLASSGVALRRVPYATWAAELPALLERLPTVDRAHSVAATLGRWQRPLDPERRGAIGTAAYRRDVRELVGRELAPVDEALVHRWARALTATLATRP